MYLDRNEFDAYRDSIESPRTGELCRVIHQPFKAKVKEGGFNPPKLRPVSNNTLGSLADKNSSRSSWLSEQVEKDREQRHREKIANIEKLEEKLGHTLPRPVLNPDRPWWRKDKDIDLSLNKMTKEETENFVQSGKKPTLLSERSSKKEKE
jgi:hypothetical protein